MRKVLTIALGLASFGAISVGPASAGYTTKEGNCLVTYAAGPGSRPPTLEGHPPRWVYHINWVVSSKSCGGAIGGSNTTQPIQQQKLKKIN